MSDTPVPIPAASTLSAGDEWRGLVSVAARDERRTYFETLQNC
jgi:hypothetical protein